MAKKYSLTIALLFIIVCACAQTIGKYKFNGKQYYVYPYRISSDDIPVMGINIPDGEYVVFENYSFKRKFSLHRNWRKKKYKLRDTTVVNAVITIKNNLAQGAAAFYEHSHKRNRSTNKKPYQVTTGMLVNGLKTGEWKITDIKDKDYEIYNYANGVKNGYYNSFRSNGQLRARKKYCNDRLCDTVFYYYDNHIIEEYDHNDKPSFGNFNSSIYDKIIYDFRNGTRLDAKTYYKKYDYSGKLLYSLKLVDGFIQPFDSIGIYDPALDTNYNELKYATIKNISPGQTVITEFDKNHYKTEKTQTFIKDGFTYASTFKKIELLRKRKNFFNRKQYIYKRDTTDNAEIYADTKTFDENSIKPVVIETKIYNGDTVRIFYIPKFDFQFSDDPEIKLLFADTVSKSIFFTKTEKHWNYNKEKLKKVRFERYINKKDYLLQIKRNNPYKSKDYIVINNITPETVENENYTERNEYENTSSNDFINETFYSTYSFRDTLINGPYFFSYNTKKRKDWDKNKKLIAPVSYYENDETGSFINGKKEGLWLGISWNEPKRLPNDLSGYFFSHPKKVRSLVEKNYKNGLKNGAYTTYKKVSETDGDLDFFEESDIEQKKSIIKKSTIFKDFETEFKNDTLNGPYKQYYANGKLRTSANFVMGKPHGDHITYHKRTGKIKCFIQFDKGYLNGKYLRYEGGVLSCYAFFKNNIISDSLIFYNSNGKPLTSIYTDNERLKEKKNFFFDGKLKEKMTFNDNSKYMLTKEAISSESFITGINSSKDSTLYKAHGSFTSYYENGQKLAEGNISKGKLSNNWKFYSINGQVLHEVKFKDTIVVLNGSKDSIYVRGLYNGYYSNGNKRCKGFITSVELNYDCFTKQDKVEPEFYVLDFFDINGKQSVKNGSGYLLKYDPNGLKTAAGKLTDFKRDSLWRYYTPEQKLDGIGYYIDDEKEGVWYTGDLEGINFEDGACFDMNNPAEVKAYEQKRKDLNISRSIYKDGNRINMVNFRSNLNKTYKPRRSHHRVDF